METKGDPCADKPAVSSRVTVAEQLPGDSYAGGEVVARTTTDADGSYRVAVAPGDYVVTADAGMSCELMDVRVTTGAYSRVGRFPATRGFADREQRPRLVRHRLEDAGSRDNPFAPSFQGLWLAL